MTMLGRRRDLKKKFPFRRFVLDEIVKRRLEIWELSVSLSLCHFLRF